LDWPRAKIILIICFFVGNLILGHQLWIQRRGHVAFDEILPRVEGDEEDTVVDQLGDKEIHLDTPVPTETPRLYPLRLSRHQPDVQILRDAFFADEEMEEVIIGGRLSGYRDDEAVLVVGGSGAVRYQKSTADIETEELTSEEVIRVTESFMEDERIAPVDSQFDYWEKIGSGNYVVYYYQQYREIPIYGGGIMLKLEGGTLREYQRVWYDALGPTSQARNVIPASRAISANIPRIAEIVEEESTIVEITLGYYAGMSDDEEWVSEPTWRLRFEDGDLIYINAFTGAIEWPL